MKLVSTLWARMTDLFGLRFTSSYGEDPMGSAGLAWARGLAGLSPAQLGEGLRKCENGCTKDGWPPTLSEFKALCLGIPTFARFEHELTLPEPERSTFVVAGSCLIDWHRYRNADGRAQTSVLRNAYDLVRDLVMESKPLPRPKQTERDTAEEDARIARAHLEWLAAEAAKIDNQENTDGN